LRRALRTTRATGSRAEARLRGGSPTEAVIGSAAAHRQMHRRLHGVVMRLHDSCTRRRVGADVAAGDVERRQRRFRVLRQAASATFDEALTRPIAAARAGLTTSRRRYG